MNTFEDKLLTELRAVVAERPVEIRRKRPKRLLVGIAACLTLAAGTAVAVPIIGGQQATSPAYAVSTQADGKVRVRIYKYTDADGLARRIRAAGVRTEVTFLPPGKKCRRAPAPVVHEMRDAVMMSMSFKSGSPPEFGLILDPAKFRGYTLLIELVGAGPEFPEGATTVPRRAKTGSFGPCVLVDR